MILNEISKNLKDFLNALKSFADNMKMFTFLFDIELSI